MSITYFKKPGYKLNDDLNKVAKIIKAIFDNNEECICHNESYDKHCPCSDFREKGECHCGLYIKDEHYKPSPREKS